MRIIEKETNDGSKERFTSIKSFVKYYPAYKDDKTVYKIRYALKHSQDKTFHGDNFTLKRFDVLS